MGCGIPTRHMLKQPISRIIDEIILGSVQRIDYPITDVIHDVFIASDKISLWR